VATVKNYVFRDVAPCSLVEVCWRFRVACLYISGCRQFTDL